MRWCVLVGLLSFSDTKKNDELFGSLLAQVPLKCLSQGETNYAYSPPERIAVAAIPLRMRILTRSEDLLANFGHQISVRINLRAIANEVAQKMFSLWKSLANGRLRQNLLAIANATAWCTQARVCVYILKPPTAGILYAPHSITQPPAQEGCFHGWVGVEAYRIWSPVSISWRFRGSISIRNFCEK